MRSALNPSTCYAVPFAPCGSMLCCCARWSQKNASAATRHKRTRPRCSLLPCWDQSNALRGLADIRLDSDGGVAQDMPETDEDEGSAPSHGVASGAG